MLPRLPLAVAALALAAPAPAQAVWSPVSPVTPASQEAAQPVLGGGTSAHLLHTLRARRAGVAAYHAAAFDARGDALLVRARRGRIEAQRLSAGGRAGRVVRLSARGARASMPAVDVSPSGRAVVAWTQYSGETPFRVAVAAGHIRSGLKRIGFADRRGLSATRPAVSISARGDALVAFAQGGVAKAADLPRGGRLRRAATLGGSAWVGGNPNLDVALARDGSAVVAWAEFTDSGEGSVSALPRLFAATRAGRGAWAATEVLDGETPWYGNHPAVAIASTGTAVVAWPGNDDQDRAVVKVATARAGSPFAVQAIGRGFAQGPMAVATDAAGGTAVVWSEQGGAEVHAAVRRPGGAFSLQQLDTMRHPVRAIAVAAVGEGRYVTAFETRRRLGRIYTARHAPNGAGD